MNRQELINLCLSFPGAIEDYPFDDGNTVIRHRGNRKWFALVFEREDKLMINLKCQPGEAILLREGFDCITPAWHMNKRHWNSVELCGELSPEALYNLIEMSYRLTAPAKSKARSTRCAEPPQDLA